MAEGTGFDARRSNGVENPVIIAFPRDHRGIQRIIGKARFKQSLHTKSLDVAERRKAPIIAKWKREIERARGSAVETDADFFASVLTAEERATIAKLAAEPGLEVLDRIAVHVQPVWDAREASALAGPRFADMLDDWLATGETTQKTRDMQRADVREFAGKFRHVADVTKPDVRRWCDKEMSGDDPVTLKTMQRKLSALRGYWKYLQSIELAPAESEPFAKLGLKAASHVAREDRRKPFTPGDVVKLLVAARAGDDLKLADLIDMARWTGARIESLCSLQIGSVKLAEPIPYVEFGDKTDAGVREVPVHPELAPVLARLIGQRRDGYVIEGLTENKYHDRSNAIGKRFGYLKTREGYGAQFKFHSIRRTVATQFENAGIPENVAAAIIGHDHPTMTFGLYSGGPSMAVKLAAIAKLAYPAEAKA